ncbi:MAG: subfamily polymerase sigma factor [Parcubacteria group bacterium]|nr:subfamily polymerase sigma factor [Parcubacteria group bacterium]
MDPTDQEAVAATLADRHSFSLLVERYQLPLSRYVARLGNLDPDTVKDILQEAFIKTYLNLNDYDPALPFSSWLYRIAHNETMMHFRRQKSRPQVLKHESDMTLFEQIPDELNIFEEGDARLRGERIQRALQDLKPQHRDVLILRFFEDKSYEEISDILRIPQGTVATHLARGKTALERRLRQEHIRDVYYGNDG